jgi:DNA polymerase/3'-5' exonuclease PolX
MPALIALEKAEAIVANLKRKGLQAEVVGGIHKKKEYLHDIDLICRSRYIDKNIQVIRNAKLRFPVELYAADDEMYMRLKKALRATTWEAIQGRLMKGLRYKKMKL